MSAPILDERDRRALRGEDGAAHRLAMELVVEMAEAVLAPRLIDIDSTHIDGCLPFGQVALDLPQHLLDGCGKVVVPTTLNVSALDLLHPEQPTG
ncbi:MAG: aconitase X, partial [Chloroflexota bacterium]